MLGGSWAVITHIRGLKTPFITTHEPPSKPVFIRDGGLLGHLGAHLLADPVQPGTWVLLEGGSFEGFRV